MILRDHAGNQLVNNLNCIPNYIASRKKNVIQYIGLAEFYIQGSFL